ncbi:MAG: TetR/AcrR family transcriptional regulator [Spirochaetia bacterium]|jgi:AcrR family transcriptional regulator|nr:TetR/AcrR family transcriptional regulator [Spirochaetia bacterium]
MDNREQLKQVALELFYEREYDGVGIQQIVDIAKLTKPTLYYYFGSKQGLYASLFRDVLEEDFRLLKDAGNYSGNFSNSLQNLVFAFARCFEANPKLYSILFRFYLAGSSGEAYAVARPYLDRLFGIFLGLFQAARAQLGNMHGREEQFAHTCLAVVVDYLFRNKDSISEGNLYELLRQYQFGIYS